MCSKIRDELSGIMPGQLHPFGRRATMRQLRGASDAGISLAEEEEAQMGTERTPLPGFKEMIHIENLPYLKKNIHLKPLKLTISATVLVKCLNG